MKLLEKRNYAYLDLETWSSNAGARQLRCTVMDILSTAEPDSVLVSRCICPYMLAEQRDCPFSTAVCAFRSVLNAKAPSS